MYVIPFDSQITLWNRIFFFFTIIRVSLNQQFDYSGSYKKMHFFMGIYMS